MGLGGVITNLLSLGAQLIPVVNASAQAPSSSSSCPPVESQQIETELKELMRLLERIKARLYDAEERRIRDLSVKLWLKELRQVAYDAEDVLDEYHYEVLRAQVEARDASPKRKLCQVPDAMLGQIRQIRSRFSEITKDRIALQLSEDDWPRHCSSDMQIVPTSHFVVKSDIIGRKREKKKLINLLSSESNDGNIISVVTIVGTGGIGKTTLAKLVYNDQNFRQNFDKFGWVFVADDFNVQRLSREVSESITEESCDFANLSALQAKISKELPFMSASLVKILVTTRNKSVARIMQTEPDAIYNIPCLSEEQSWQMFQHFAFDNVVPHTDSNFVEIGKKIMRKCGKLPLAIKSIASLLRHEPNEENWKKILETVTELCRDKPRTCLGLFPEIHGLTRYFAC
ncbi:Disease resistance protein (CC-NBS-LRR class) family [Rhynchospora pubera]|uniref:Disease resistance protein (CC-NBS-LRR class) family n=1 Tax=Rhynchospora pubera TaxID=906938 RepID=A0AAV8HUK9_9POAL|nr:Disease resistance protein (CC-NBS-LRR class) family [Rhynchospora pubera]